MWSDSHWEHVYGVANKSLKTFCGVKTDFLKPNILSIYKISPTTNFAPPYPTFKLNTHHCTRGN